MHEHDERREHAKDETVGASPVVEQFEQVRLTRRRQFSDERLHSQLVADGECRRL